MFLYVATDYLMSAEVTFSCMFERRYFPLTEMGDRVFNLEMEANKHRNWLCILNFGGKMELINIKMHVIVAFSTLFKIKILGL